MSQTSSAPKNFRDLALDLAWVQTLVLGVAFGGELLERFVRVRTPDWSVFLLAALTLNLLFIWAERKGQRVPESGQPDEARNTAIDRLYSELRQLMSQPELGSRAEIERRLASLRTLQQEEAAAMRQRYEARSSLKPGTGWQALSRAQELLAENANSSGTNPTLSRKA